VLLIGVQGYEITATSPSALRREMPEMIFEPISVVTGRDEKGNEQRETRFNLKDTIEYGRNLYHLQYVTRAENHCGVTTRIRYALQVYSKGRKYVKNICLSRTDVLEHAKIHLES